MHLSPGVRLAIVTTLAMTSLLSGGLTYALTENLTLGSITSIAVSFFSILIALRLQMLPVSILKPPTALLEPSIAFFAVLGLPITWFFSQITAYAVYHLVGSSAYETYAQNQQDYSVTERLISHLVAAPIVEEFLFRGLLFTAALVALQKVTSQLTAFILAAVSSTVVFAGIHFNLVQFSLTLTLSVFLCLLVAVTGSIWSAVAAHACFNLLSTFFPLTMMNQHLAATPNVLLGTIIILSPLLTLVLLCAIRPPLKLRL